MVTPSLLRTGVLPYLRTAAAGLRRNPLRSLLTVLAVSLAVCLFLGALGLHDGYARSLARNVDRMGYHVLVTAKGCPYETATLVLRGGDIPMYVDESLVAALEADPAYAGGTRFLMQSVAGPGGSSMRVYLGVDDRFMDLKPWMEFQQGGWFSGPEAAEAILGDNVAEVLRLKPGDTLEVSPSIPPVRVVGILGRSGSQDDGMIFLPLTFSQKLFDRQGKLTGVGVKLTDMAALGPFLDRVFETPSLQAITVTRFRAMMLDLLGTARALMLIGTAVALVIAALGVFNAVLVSVTERRRELGVYKMLGASPLQIFALVATETALLGLAGGLGGLALVRLVASVSDGFVSRLLPYAPLPDGGHLVAVGMSHALLGLAGALGVALLAGMLPAVRASLAPAVQSLRGLRP